MIDLISGAHELLRSPYLTEKRRIITITFPNLGMNANKLVSIMKKPLDMSMNLLHV